MYPTVRITAPTSVAGPNPVMAVSPSSTRAAALQRLGQTIVQNLDPALSGDEDVVGFQVAMRDVFAMGACQPVSNLDGIVNRLALWKSSPGEYFAQARL
jgi:hypothetical protein